MRGAFSRKGVRYLYNREMPMDRNLCQNLPVELCMRYHSYDILKGAKRLRKSKPS